MNDLSTLASKIFPISIPAYDTGHYVESSHLFRKLFQMNRPKDVTWFGYDVIVLSLTQVEFHVRDMASSMGGLGKVTYKFVINVSPEDTKIAVHQRILQIAERKRQDELAAAELAIITRYADAIATEVYPEFT